MLRFRMKMLSKENLIARTSDIGFCLGLLTGKLLIVGFVIGAFSANAMDPKEMDPKEFDTLNPVALKRRAKEVLSERNALLSEINALLSERNALQEQLDLVTGVQSGRQTPSDKENVKPSSSLWAICCGARTTS